MVGIRTFAFQNALKLKRCLRKDEGAGQISGGERHLSGPEEEVGEAVSV